MLKKELNKITGGLSKPSKMPGPAYNLPAAACITGSKLVKIKGSVCEGCYALKGRYRFGNVQAALQRRLKAIEDPRWVDAMIQLIKGQEYFRWHEIPRNLVIRFSSHMINQAPVNFFPWTSTVVTDGQHSCPASTQGNSCGSCRQCWNREEKNVSYPKH
jgi:hypothetical protein